MNLQRILFIIFIPVLIGACKKWTDKKGPDVPVGDRKYCNDPEAVNYNWNFPGTPDSTICYYPTDLFKGTYSFTDSIYNDDNAFDSIKSLTTYTLQVIPISTSRFAIMGFCGPNDSLRFTSERTGLNASADTTIQATDTTLGFGQYFCRIQDTLSGSVSRPQNDTTNSYLFINFTVVSDTGVNFHRGTAVKQ